MDKKELIRRLNTPEAQKRKKEVMSERAAFISRYEEAQALQDHEERMAKTLPAEFRYNTNNPKYKNALALRRARTLFLMDYPFERIFLETDIPYSYFVRLRKKWTVLKDRVDETVLEKIRNKAIGGRAEDFVQKGLTLGLRFLDRALKNGDDLTPKDFKLIMDSVMGIHRVKQLETGGATDIAVYEKMSPEELRDYLEATKKEILAENPEMLEFLPLAVEKKELN